MSNIKLDLNGFKYHSSDENSTTLHHEKLGHKLTLAHNVLSPENRTVLKAISKGKENIPKPQYGNITRKYDDGGIVDTAKKWIGGTFGETPEPNTDVHNTKPAYPTQSKTGKSTKYAKGGDVRTIHGKLRSQSNDHLESGRTQGISTQGEDVRISKKVKTANLPDSAIKKTSEGFNKFAKDEAKGRAEMERTVKPNIKGLADGGEIKNADVLCNNCQGEGCWECEEPQKYAEGTQDEPVSENKVPEALRANDDSNKPQLPINLTINTAPQPQQTPNVSQQPPASLAADPNSTKPDQSQPDQPAQQAPSASIQQPQAAPIPAPASPQALAPPSPVQDQPEESRNAYDDYKAKHMADFAQENAAFEHDLANGHITPETYGSLFAKKDTLGKLGTVFGMLLSGAGSGLAHQPNALLQLMQHQIDNDLNAQMRSKENAQNFLRLNQNLELNKAQVKQLGVDTQAKAFALAQSQMLQSTYHSFVDKVNKMPEGPQKEAAKQQLGIMYSKMADRINNVNDQAAGASAYYNSIFGPGGQTAPEGESNFQKRQSGLMALGPEGTHRAQYENDRHFPGLPGQASVPLSGGDRDEINSGMTFDQKLRRFTDWAKNHSGDLNPKEIYEGKALAAELQGAYRQATHGGVYKEGEQNFISKLIDENPTKFFNGVRVLPQLNALAGESQQRIDQKVKSLGFKGYEPPVYRNGAQYRKVQGGYQKVK